MDYEKDYKRIRKMAKKIGDWNLGIGKDQDDEWVMEDIEEGTSVVTKGADAEYTGADYKIMFFNTLKFLYEYAHSAACKELAYEVMIEDLWKMIKQPKCPEYLRVNLEEDLPIFEIVMEELVPEIEKKDPLVEI